MTSRAAAQRPPAGLPDLEPSWSRLVSAPDFTGVRRVWHLLDNQVDDPSLTLLCVHGNPTWSFAFRQLVASAPAGIRVVAVDQLDMGYSERTGTSRRLADRIEDLCRLTEVLDIDGPVVTVGHDWGGPISLGWALRHRSNLAGVVLTNTAVHQPETATAPNLIRLVRLPGVLETVCRRTSAFVSGALWATGDRHHKEVRQAYHAPYGTPDRRSAIAMFVRDIPLDQAHPSDSALSQLAAEVGPGLSEVPALLMWGPSDPVFSDLYLADLMERIPHAQVHRFVGSGHLVHEHPDAPGVIYEWLSTRTTPRGDNGPSPDPSPSLWERIESRAGDDQVAVVELHDSVDRRLTFQELSADVARIGAGLASHGVKPGDRVALMVPPGLDLTATLYACWRIGAVVVIVDAGLGPKGITQAMRSARPDYLIGIPRAIRAAAALRWPGRRISSTEMSRSERAISGVETDLPTLRAMGVAGQLPAPPHDEDLAAVAFTSGATGPAKGVAYRHHQARAQRDALMKLYGIRPDDRLVAAFAPFALYGPTMGITSVVPDMDVTAPSTLTARALADAVASIGATLVFASPAALRNIAATSSALTEEDLQVLQGVRLLMSAGAPVHPDVLRQSLKLMPNAEAHTPYGMTEALPVADISLAEIDAVGDGNGVCVGHPLEGVDVMIDPLDAAGAPSGEPTTEPAVTGEILVRAAHIRDGYDRLWATQVAASRPPGWHRTGDAGHLDDGGRLWVEGRLIHVISTTHGPVTPVGIEHDVERLDGIRQAAAVGVGPQGTQHVVVVAVTEEDRPTPRSADLDLLDEIRRAVDVDVAAVLLTAALPVDVRHNSKIDRPRIATWAAAALAGHRIGGI